MNADDPSQLPGATKSPDGAEPQPTLESMTKEQLLALIAEQAAAQLELQREKRILGERLKDQVRQEARLHNMLDGVPALIAYYDCELRMRFANRRYLEWSSMPASSLMGLHVRQIVGEAYFQECHAHMEAAVRGERRTFEGERVGAAGNLATLHVDYVPDIQHGEVHGFIELAHDITTRKQALKALVRSEARMRALLDVLPARYYQCASDGRILAAYGSETGEFIDESGKLREPSSQLGQSAADVVAWRELEENPSVREQIRAAAVQARTTGTIQVHQYSLRIPGGVQHFASRVNRGPDDESMTALVFNITRRVHAEAQHRASQALLISERKNVAYQLAEQELRLRAAIAYDLHDGVGQTLAGARLLVEGALEICAKPLQPRLRRLSKLLTDSIEQIRHLSRRLRVPDIIELPLTDGLRMLASQTTQLFKIQCTVDAAAELPEPTPMAKTQAYLVAQEAVVNAARHSRGSCIRIELGRHGQRYRLCVSDDGKGLSGTSSAGLGLASMDYRARMLGGALEVDSQPDAGTVVTMEWPIEESDPGGPPAPR